jgi:hypothetical protein
VRPKYLSVAIGTINKAHKHYTQTSLSHIVRLSLQSIMTSRISREQIEILRSQVKEPASVLYPDSEGYENSLERWSEVGFQRAVPPIPPHRTLYFG